MNSKQGSSYYTTDIVSEHHGLFKEQEEVKSGSLGCQQQDTGVERPEAPQIAETGDGKKLHWRRVSAGLWQLLTLNQALTSSVERNKPDT